MSDRFLELEFQDLAGYEQAKYFFADDEEDEEIGEADERKGGKTEA
ncbi:hypothetical protein [Flavobacterium fluviatile]|nr:hypothetical protein [Flavobacterium fluviatile]